jgi:hypothetical protein
MAQYLQATEVPELLFELNGRDIIVGPDIERQARELMLKALMAAGEAHKIRKRKQNVAQQIHGVVTQEMRLDFTVLNPIYDSHGVIIAGTVAAYEGELRPSGGNTWALLDPVFRANRAAARAQPGWITPVEIISAQHHGVDQRLSQGTIYTIDEYLALPTRPPAITWVTMPEVRTNPRWNSIMPHLVAPLREDKSYGLLLGWWHLVQDFDWLPWLTSFMIKPLGGTRAQGVMRWDPTGQSGATRNELWKAVRQGGRKVWAPYAAPIPTGRPGDPHMMLRFMYAIDTSFKANPKAGKPPKLILLGGANLSQADPIIHGTPDTRTGLLMVAA